MHNGVTYRGAAIIRTAHAAVDRGEGLAHAVQGEPGATPDPVANVVAPCPSSVASTVPYIASALTLLCAAVIKQWSHDVMVDNAHHHV